MAGTGGAHVLDVNCANYHPWPDVPASMHVCMTHTALSAQTEMTPLLQQALTCSSRALSVNALGTLTMQSQVKPACFNSRMTRVGHHSQLKMPDNSVLYLTPNSIHIAYSYLSCFEFLV